MKNDKKARAIVINAADTKEADKIITLYTLEEGRVCVQAKGIRKASAKLKAGAQLFCFGEFIMVQRGDSHVLTGCTPEDLFEGITADGNRYYAGMLVLELLNSCTNEREPCPQLFISAVKALSALVYTDADTQSVKLKFMLDTLAYGGYSQDYECCSECGALSVPMHYDAERGVLCTACAGRAAVISNNALCAIREAAAKEYDGISIAGIGINSAIRIIRETIEYDYKTRIRSII